MFPQFMPVSLTPVVKCLAMALACLTLLTCPSRGATFDLQHIHKVVTVGSPQISPDGKSIVVVATRANKDTNKYDSELVIVDIATRSQRVLTRGRAWADDPRWSPTGDRLAFLAKVNEKSQLFILPLAGGDPLQVTKAPTGVQQYAWRPDGIIIAFISPSEPEKTEGEERHNRSFEAQNNDLLTTAAPLPSCVWTVPAEGGSATRLAVAAGWQSSGFARPSWSPDGRSLALPSVPSPYSGDAHLSTIKILDSMSGTARPLTRNTKKEQGPQFSPDGWSVAFHHPRDNSALGAIDVWASPITGGRAVNVTSQLDRNIHQFLWMPDGKAILVVGNDGTSAGTWLAPLTGTPRRLDTGAVVPIGISVGRQGQIAYTGSAPNRPSELYYSESVAAKPMRLTDFNQEIAALSLGRVDTLSWTGPDGHSLDGVVTYPPGYSPAKKYPLVVQIHGGPTSASVANFSFRTQYLAAQGWVVFEPNYRGSDNRGHKFQTAILSTASAGPGRDIMSGVDYLIQKGIVDETRTAVSGWSYGGQLTVWLLGNYPNRWSAGVAGAAVVDLLDQYNLSDANIVRGDRVGGSPWTDPARHATMLSESPITHAPRIKAPTLILSNTGDFRVPITNSYKLYHALRDNGVKTQFIAYPLKGHSPSDPIHIADVSRRWANWIKEHFEGTLTQSPELPSQSPHTAAVHVPAAK